MPQPALGRMVEIITGYTSLSAKPMKGLCAPELGLVRVPQPPQWTKKARKKKKLRVKKTQKVSEKEKSRKIDGRKRGKMTKEKRWRVKACRFRRKKIRMRSKRKPRFTGARNRKYSAPWSANKMFFKLEWHRQPALNQRKKAAQKMKARRKRRAIFIQDKKKNMAEKAQHLQFKRELLAEIAQRQIETTENRKWDVIFELRTMFTWKRKVPKALNKWKAMEEGVKETARQLAQTVQYVVGIQKELTQTILDSGAMVNSGCSKKTKMDNLKPMERPVEVLGCTGASAVCTRYGEWTLPTMHSKHDLTLQNVLDIPDSHQNLVSVGCLDDAGMKTVFENQEGKVYAPDGEIMLVFKKLDGLYVLQDNKGKVMRINPQKVVQWEVANLLKIHQALGHISFKRCRALMNFPPESMDSPDPVCTGCLKAQMVLLKSDKEGQRAAPRYGYRLHSDTSRKFPDACDVFGKTGIQRFQLMGDEFTGTLWIDFLTRKSDAKRAVISRIDKINNELGGDPVVEHQTDKGKEYDNNWLNKKLAVRRVEPRHSAPYTQSENGWIEQRMWKLQTGAQAMMWTGKAPVQDYPYALRHWIYLQDMLPNGTTRVSPYEKRVGIPPKLKPGMVEAPLFCTVYAKVYVHSKLQRDAVKCVYLGKDPKSNGILVRKIGGKKQGIMVRSAHAVKFVTDEFPYSNPLIPRPPRVAGYNFDSDSDQGEENIDLKSDDGYDSEEEGDDSEPEQSQEEELSSEDDDDLEDEEPEEKKENAAQKQSLMEPEDEDEDPDGDIDGEDAWEVKEIIDEKKIKKGKKRYTHYKIVWSGDYPDSWEVKSNIRAPDVVRAWEQKKKQAKQSLTMITKRYCQLNMCVEPISKQGLKAEVNPFKALFAPGKEQRPKNPVGYKSMMAHRFADYFVQALIKEKMENLKWKAYEEVPRSSVPKGTKILRPMTAYQIKYNALGEIEKFKSRVCLDGSKTQVDEDETYEAIADFGTIRLLLCLATRYDMEIVQTDVKNFFLQATMPPDKQYYTEIPDGWAENDPKTHVAKVLAPWYGLKESAKLAGDQLAEALAEAGMRENPLMPKVFWKWDGDDLIICASHIDDACWISTSMKKLDKVLDKVEEKFQLDRTYNPTKLLGVEIDYDRKRGKMKLHQGSYNRAKAKEMDMGGKKPARSPGHIPPKIVNPLFPGGNKVQATQEQVRNYQKKIGVQMWSLQTDPSSMYTVYQLAKHMLNPQKEHWEAMQRLERYKFSNPEIGIVFRRAASG